MVICRYHFRYHLQSSCRLGGENPTTRETHGEKPQRPRQSRIRGQDVWTGSLRRSLSVWGGGAALTWRRTFGAHLCVPLLDVVSVFADGAGVTGVPDHRGAAAVEDRLVVPAYLAVLLAAQPAVPRPPEKMKRTVDQWIDHRIGHSCEREGEKERNPIRCVKEKHTGSRSRQGTNASIYR